MKEEEEEREGEGECGAGIEEASFEEDNSGRDEGRP